MGIIILGLAIRSEYSSRLVQFWGAIILAFFLGRRGQCSFFFSFFHRAISALLGGCTAIEDHQPLFFAVGREARQGATVMPADELGEARLDAWAAKLDQVFGHGLPVEMVQLRPDFVDGRCRFFYDGDGSAMGGHGAVNCKGLVSREWKKSSSQAGESNGLDVQILLTLGGFFGGFFQILAHGRGRPTSCRCCSVAGSTLRHPLRCPLKLGL